MKTLILAMLSLCLASCTSIEKIADFSDPDFKGEIWVKELRHDRQRIVVKVNYKEQDDILHKYFVIYPYGLDNKETVKQAVPEALKEFLEQNYQSHEGILGGTVKYKIVSLSVSPGGIIAFIILGDYGHAIFNPTIFVSDRNGENIKKIDSARNEMCLDLIWISKNELIYAKDSKVYKARIR